ncbi:hypothetical protein PRIC2_011419 [Phytophthora ramorum]
MSWSLPFYFPGYPLRRRCTTLCKHIRAGNIDGVQELLRKDSRLVHARNKKGVTLLMLAAIHPDAALAVQMIDELVSEGASLGRRDRRNRHVLLHACLHGAGRAVMERLLEHGGYSIFKWNDFGIDGQTALLLACTRADTPMTTFLLDRIEIETYAKHNHPFKVLKAAIDTGNERHALETAQHEKIRASIQDPERTRYKGSGATELAWTISTCTEAAVGKSMMQLVQVMDQFNWRKVSRAVWYMVNQLVREGVDVYATVPAELLTIGKQFTGDWRWSLVRELCVARFGSGDEGQTHPLARLPDDAFLRVAAFVVPPPFRHPSEYVSQWCRCSGRALFGECYWHDSYKATRSDYHWPYNWTGSS